MDPNSAIPAMYKTLKSAIHWGSSMSLLPPTPTSSDLCETCGRKQKYVENGFKHPYCSRTCAKSTQPTIRASGRRTPMPTCAIRGCRAPAVYALGGYCSDAHACDAVRYGKVQGCAQCKEQYPSVGPLCVSCDAINRDGPRTREVDPRSVTFTSIATHFAYEWKGDNPPPMIERILEVFVPRDIHEKFERYRSELDASAYLRDLRTYHASQCICDLGVNDVAFCNWKSCGICNTVKSSFRSFAFGDPYLIGRHGDGVYSYVNPALADRHATSSTSSPFRVMIACDVVIASKNDRSQVDDGKRIFVANPRAIIPSYILLYRV